MTQKITREHQRAQCIALRKVGMSYRAIATDESISRSSIQRALERLEETGDFRDRSHSGRLEKLNEGNVRMLKNLGKDDDNRNSARELVVKLNESLDKPIFRRTIINYLQKCGYEYKIKIKKTFLNKEHRKARLQ